MGQSSSFDARRGQDAAPAIVGAPLDPQLMDMAGRPPLQCSFHYETQVVHRALHMPLVYAYPPRSYTHERGGNQEVHVVGTLLQDLELWLREQLQLPMGATVFAVMPANELYSPPYPLVMLNAAAVALYRRCERDHAPVLALGVVVRSMSRLREPVLRVDAPESPFFAISASVLASRSDSIARQYARMRFVENMKTYGFARLEVTPAQAQIPQQAFARVRTWLAQEVTKPRDQRWREKVNPVKDSAGLRATDRHYAEVEKEDEEETIQYPTVSAGRYVGFSADPNREYLQLRRPLAHSGTVWPPRGFLTPEECAFADEMLVLLNLLDAIARDCMRTISEVLNLDSDYVETQLLDDTTPPPAPGGSENDDDNSSDILVNTGQCVDRYGASVLRVYNYRNKDSASNPEDTSCGVHADLGLVTVSPVATVPGLQMWNLDRMVWTDVEADAGPLHFSVFAGETLGLMTHGVIKAPLHRVPAVVVSTEEERRMSMPYFLRAKPRACLNPRAEPASRITCREFMEDVVFQKRPWRRDDALNPTPDY